MPLCDFARFVRFLWGQQPVSGGFGGLVRLSPLPAAECAYVLFGASSLPSRKSTMLTFFVQGHLAAARACASFLLTTTTLDALYVMAGTVQAVLHRFSFIAAGGQGFWLCAKMQHMPFQRESASVEVCPRESAGVCKISCPRLFWWVCKALLCEISVCAWYSLLE